jgi:hypothetical protein
MGQPADPAKPATEQDRYVALARMVADVSQDHTRLRSLIYEFARIKLRKELYIRFVDGEWDEINDQMQGLENAIDRIETNFQQPALPPPPGLASSHEVNGALVRGSSLRSIGWQEPGGFGDEAKRAQTLLLRAAGHPAPSFPIAPTDHLANAVLGKHLQSKFWRNTELIFAVAIGVVICATIDSQAFLNPLGLSKWRDSLMRIAMTSVYHQRPDQPVDEKPSNAKSGEIAQSSVVAIPTATSVGGNSIPRSVGGIPVPAEYGVYAVVNGRLAELEQLQLKVPDPRVAISATFSAPSRTHLPNGKVEFVIFRRDFANSAPDRVSARIVARVTRVLTFDREGNAKTATIDESWVVRSNEYQLRVGPFADNPEMVLVHPDKSDFAFPSGRYELILKGIGYDFTVDGPPTDTAHCLERTEALDAPVYSECRKL